MNIVREIRTDQEGNVAITAAVVLSAMVAAGGASVSYLTGSATRTSLQSSLDAAVLGAASASDLRDAARSIALARKIFDGDVGQFARNSTKHIKAHFAVNGATISGEAAGQVINPFAGVIGPKTYPVSAKAAAIKEMVPICVLGLNALDNGTFNINGSASFNADCAVQTNSEGTYAMAMEGQPTAKAKKFAVSGGHKGEGFSPAPIDDAPRVADPYASLPFPAFDNCASGKGINLTDVRADRKLSPGTYCNGIHIHAGAQVTLEPGIYVMSNGPFWVNGGATVKGDQVMIAFTGNGSTLQVWGNSSVTLTSPTSGRYANMQFFQDWRDYNTRGMTASIGGSDGNDTGDGSKLSFDGVAYFPMQILRMFGTAVINANSPSVAVVADKIATQGNATVNITSNNHRKLPVVAGPTTTYAVRLIK